MKYRVLWIDGASEGRFTDVTASNDAEAAWKVAIDTGSQIATFVNVDVVTDVCQNASHDAYGSPHCRECDR